MDLDCLGLLLAEGLDPCVEDTNDPGFDLEVDLMVIWLSLDGADDCVTSFDVTTEEPTSFRDADSLFLCGSFLDVSVPVRTQRAFSSARSSKSISSFSPGEVLVSKDSRMETCGYSLVILPFNLCLSNKSL